MLKPNTPKGHFSLFEQTHFKYPMSMFYKHFYSVGATVSKRYISFSFGCLFLTAFHIGNHLIDLCKSSFFSTTIWILALFFSFLFLSSSIYMNGAIHCPGNSEFPKGHRGNESNWLSTKLCPQLFGSIFEVQSIVYKLRALDGPIFHMSLAGSIGLLMLPILCYYYRTWMNA